MQRLCTSSTNSKAGTHDSIPTGRTAQAVRAKTAVSEDHRRTEGNDWQVKEPTEGEQEYERGEQEYESEEYESEDEHESEEYDTNANREEYES